MNKHFLHAFIFSFLLFLNTATHAVVIDLSKGAAGFNGTGVSVSFDNASGRYDQAFVVPIQGPRWQRVYFSFNGGAGGPNSIFKFKARIANTLAYKIGVTYVKDGQVTTLLQDSKSVDGSMHDVEHTFDLPGLTDASQIKVYFQQQKSGAEGDFRFQKIDFVFDGNEPSQKSLNFKEKGDMAFDDTGVSVSFDNTSGRYDQAFVVPIQGPRWQRVYFSFNGGAGGPNSIFKFKARIANTLAYKIGVTYVKDGQVTTLLQDSKSVDGSMHDVEHTFDLPGLTDASQIKVYFQQQKSGVEGQLQFEKVELSLVEAEAAEVARLEQARQAAAAEAARLEQERIIREAAAAEQARQAAVAAVAAEAAAEAERVRQAEVARLEQEQRDRELAQRLHDEEVERIRLEQEQRDREAEQVRQAAAAAVAAEAERVRQAEVARLEQEQRDREAEQVRQAAAAAVAAEAERVRQAEVARLEQEQRDREAAAAAAAAAEQARQAEVVRNKLLNEGWLLDFDAVQYADLLSGKGVEKDSWFFEAQDVNVLKSLDNKLLPGPRTLAFLEFDGDTGEPVYGINVNGTFSEKKVYLSKKVVARPLPSMPTPVVVPAPIASSSSSSVPAAPAAPGVDPNGGRMRNIPLGPEGSTVGVESPTRPAAPSILSGAPLLSKSAADQVAKIKARPHIQGHSGGDFLPTIAHDKVVALFSKPHVLIGGHTYKLAQPYDKTYVESHKASPQDLELRYKEKDAQGRGVYDLYHGNDLILADMLIVRGGQPAKQWAPVAGASQEDIKAAKAPVAPASSSRPQGLFISEQPFLNGSGVPTTEQLKVISAAHSGGGDGEDDDQPFDMNASMMARSVVFGSSGSKNTQTPKVKIDFGAHHEKSVGVDATIELPPIKIKDEVNTLAQTIPGHKGKNGKWVPKKDIPAQHIPAQYIPSQKHVLQGGYVTLKGKFHAIIVGDVNGVQKGYVAYADNGGQFHSALANRNPMKFIMNPALDDHDMSHPRPFIEGLSVVIEGESFLLTDLAYYAKNKQTPEAYIDLGETRTNKANREQAERDALDQAAAAVAAGPSSSGGFQSTDHLVAAFSDRFQHMGGFLPEEDGGDSSDDGWDD